MQSCAWMNGQYHQVGPPPSQFSQAPAQFTHITMRNQQAGSADNSCQYRTANTGVRPPQSANFTYDNGANPNRQPSKWPNSAVPHQAVSSQQPAEQNSYHLRVLIGNLQQSSTNTQSGNHSLPVTSVFQQDFHQSPAQNSLTQSPPNTMKVNTTHPQQNMSAHWNQTVRVQGKQSVRAQEGNVVSDLQRYGNPNSLFHIDNGESTKSFPAYTTTVISPPQQNVIYSGILVPDPPDYSMAISQSVRNSSITTNSSSWGQVVQVSSMSQKPQQYSTHNNGGEAKSSTDSNLCSRQYEIAMIARIADDLRKSFPAASGGPSPVYSRSPSGRKQFGSEVRVTASNQNMQPVTSTVSQSYNSNASQSLSLNSGHFLPKMIHDVMSTKHSVVVPQQQNSVPNVFHVMPTGDGKGNGSKTANNFIRKNVGSLSAASYLKQLSESISSQQNETQSSVASNRERLEMRSSVKTNDTSSHSSPGRTRAVAVVQPLSHESFQVACKQTCPKTISQLSEGTAMDESLSNSEKFFISPKNRSYSYTNQMTSNKSAIKHSAASNTGTSVSSSDSAGLRDLLQKQSCVDDTGPELANSMQVDQAVASSAQQLETSEAQATQSGDKDNSEMPTDPKGVFELSSLPTTPWTVLTLTKLIQDAEKSQTERKDFPKFDCLHKLLDMFWKGSSKNLISEFKAGWMNEMADVQKFCNEHVKSDSVILSQVKHHFRKQLKSFHVLRDNEVYSELPYKSTWLNANDQLDDIDKEFGFPWSLKHQLLMPESDSHPEEVQIDNGISAQIVSEMSNKIALEPVGSREEKQESTVGTASTQTASPKRMESADSSDPYCNIEIHVLPSEEARAIFEQAQSQLSQSTDTDNQPERVRSSSVLDEPPKVMDAALSDTKVEKEPVCPIKEICCIGRYIELIWGPNTTSSSKCRCKYEQSHEDITDKALDKEEMVEQKKNIVISSAKGESQAKAGENVGSHVMTLYWPELRNEQGHTTDLTEDEHKPNPYSDKEQKNISQVKIHSRSSIILIDESEDDLSSSENEVSNKMKDFENDSEQAQVKVTKSNQSSGSNKKETKEFFRSDTEIQSDLGVDCVRGQLTSTGSMQSCTSKSSNQDIEDLCSSESEVASQMSDLEENCGRAQLTATNVAESSLETGEQTDMSATGTVQTTWSSKHATVERKKKRPSSHDHFFPVFNKSKKCKSLADLDSQPVFEGASKCGRAFVDEVDNELSASNVKTAELVLFGSTPQDRCVSVGCRKSTCSYPMPESDAVPRPPKVITVKFSPLRRKSAEEYSVKQQLYEKFRSFPPSKTRHRRKLRKQKCTFSSSSVGSLSKAEMVRTINTEELPVSYKMRKCLSLKWRRFLSNKLKREKEKRKYSVTLNQLADQERSKAENGSHAVTPLKNNIVLKFTVLPDTFNFKDGSSGKEEFSDPVPDKPDLVEEMDRSHNTAVTKATGKWLPNLEKKHRPLVKTYSIFNEYQKKFMERRQTSTD
ncbi:uncharacterized protein si:ch211-106e7.2 [Epinephelus fuscoguttatus]|uniref:uncharacterized protein si:ch211-106e7.2 n=1 Tax=Epinephelus fuscoguttatus TaxID=293821 RepID=UPI0020D135F1|nr:uncharacterized protein si:ch211-106e7.2 [Epinephelus fuscoguttatus]